MKKAFEKAGSGLNIYYAPGAAIVPKGVAKAAFASGNLIDARDLKASYCAVSQAERLKKNDGFRVDNKVGRPARYKINNVP